ncbi:hypothetical protein BGZ94_008842 [Podila epigama]|nr:hypothetical protein BGZ94_008842 [Podila epigama]
MVCYRKWDVSCAQVIISPLLLSSALSTVLPTEVGSPLSTASTSIHVGALIPNVSATSTAPPIPMTTGMSNEQGFFDKTVEISGVRIPMIALVGGGLGVLLIIMVLLVCFICQRRKRRRQRLSKTMAKGKGLLNHEKNGHGSECDQGEDSEEGDDFGTERVRDHHKYSPFSTGSLAMSKSDGYTLPSFSSSSSPSSSSSSVATLLPIASRHLSEDALTRTLGDEVTVPMSCSPRPSSTSSFGQRFSACSSHQLPPIRRDALLSTVSLSAIPYVPKSTFVPRTCPRSDSISASTLSSRCDVWSDAVEYIDLIPVEATPVCAPRPLIKSSQSHDVLVTVPREDLYIQSSQASVIDYNDDDDCNGSHEEGANVCDHVVVDENATLGGGQSQETLLTLLTIVDPDEEKVPSLQKESGFADAQVQTKWKYSNDTWWGM